jgi:hypothetical protein
MPRNDEQDQVASNRDAGQTEKTPEIALICAEFRRRRFMPNAASFVHDAKVDGKTVGLTGKGKLPIVVRTLIILFEIENSDSNRITIILS